MERGVMNSATAYGHRLFSTKSFLRLQNNLYKDLTDFKHVSATRLCCLHLITSACEKGHPVPANSHPPWALVMNIHHPACLPLHYRNHTLPNCETPHAHAALPQITSMHVIPSTSCVPKRQSGCHMDGHVTLTGVSHQTPPLFFTFSSWERQANFQLRIQQELRGCLLRSLASAPFKFSARHTLVHHTHLTPQFTCCLSTFLSSVWAPYGSTCSSPTSFLQMHKCNAKELSYQSPWNF